MLTLHLGRGLALFESDFEAAIALIRSGVGRDALQRLISNVLFVAAVPVAFCIVYHPEGEFLIASHGLPDITAFQNMPFGESLGIEEVDLHCVVPNLSRHPKWKRHRVVTRRGWRWFAAVAVPLPMLPWPILLVCADVREQPLQNQSNIIPGLGRFAAILADQLQFLGLTRNASISLPSVTRVQPNDGKACISRVDSRAVVSDFLLETVIKRHRAINRRQTTYHAVATWRRSIKDSQIAALRVLKRDPSDYFVSSVATQIATMAKRLYQTVFSTVVAVPCGSSGEICFAELLAEQVALQLQRPYYPSFCKLNVRQGNSHPRKNIGRSPMQLIRAPPGPVLLLDDVATSGRHIDEAAEQLRSTGVAVFPIVWIAA